MLSSFPHSLRVIIIERRRNKQGEEESRGEGNERGQRKWMLLLESIAGRRINPWGGCRIS
jgi:hypothetical protein